MRTVPRLSLALFLVGFLLTSGIGDPQASELRGGSTGGPDSIPDRGFEPVSFLASSLADLHGKQIGDLGLFRYDPAAGEFQPIPFQIDERLEKVFNEGMGDEYTEWVYDVFGDEDGTLDADDELVFLFGDAGPKAPIDAVWPPGSEPCRFEISVTDPRPVGPSETQWVYLYSGPGLPVSNDSHITWDGQATTSITTEKYSLDFSDRWLLDGYRVSAPCGSGSDLIDRFKARADTGEAIETEEDFNLTAIYLGGIAGPIRAIRYVRGAASGYNTIHHDIVYREYWVRHFDIRVHPIPLAWLYFDWLPLPDAAFYSTTVLDGVPVDGVPDSVGTTFAHWNLVRSGEGGLVVFFDVPPSPLWSTSTQHYRDDLTYNDAPGGSLYLDEDDSAYGSHGVALHDMLNSHTDAIPIGLKAYPLCSDVGDGNLGASYEELIDNPLQPSINPQDADRPEVANVVLNRDGMDIVLAWPPVAPGITYEVFYSDFPDLPRETWSSLGETANTVFRDVAAIPQPDRYYDVRVKPGP